MEKIWFGEAQLSKAIVGEENRYLKLKKHQPGETIFGSGTSPQNLYFSLQGVVKLTRVQKTGKEILMVLLPEQSWFGLLPMFLAPSVPEDQAVALTPVTLISIPIRQFQQELEQSTELGELIAQQLSARLLRTEMMIESRLRKTLVARLVSLLLILARDFGVETDSGIKIDLPLSHQMLAEAIGSHRVVVTKLLVKLRKQHKISIWHQKITLHNPRILSLDVDFPLPSPSGS